jgi:D-alanine-D-alanine ligase
MHKISLDAYRAVRVRDYGRIDLRLTDTNDIYVIEVNANCYLDQSSEFVTAAAAAGFDYPTLIDKIVEVATQRQKVNSAS